MIDPAYQKITDICFDYIGVSKPMADDLYALLKEEKVKELESLPFTDRETGCMDCIATCMVDDRIKELKESK